MRAASAFIAVGLAFLSGWSAGDEEARMAAWLGLLSVAYFVDGLTNWMNRTGEALAAPIRRRTAARHGEQSDEAPRG